MDHEVDVAVVGAGLAGLVTARGLRSNGATVAVLEARSRVGGRILNAEIGDGEVVEIGGQWVGPTQDRVLALAAELGLETFPTYDSGASLLQLGGRRRRYSGTIPRLGLLVLADIAQARFRLERMASKLDPSAPWRAPTAGRQDGRTLGDWLRRGMLTRSAREMMRIAGRTIWGAEPEDMSLLHALFYMRAAGGLDPLLDVEGGGQESRIVGGSQRLALGLAAELGSALLLDSPVTSIEVAAENASSAVTVKGPAMTVAARRAVVAVPVHQRSAIAFSPPLPSQHQALAGMVRFGRVIKCVAVYEQPFWRTAGLSGEALSDQAPVGLTFDNSPPSGRPGVLLGFIGGRDADEQAQLTTERRRERVLACFSALFGPEAGEPRSYIEQDWTAEPYSGGGPTFLMPPGAWSSAGPALREPVGPIHWAGSETADGWAGFMDGAVRSGERAAAEVLATLP